jgi:glutamate dehydrogenase/leucine dehydrogenase
MAADSILGKQPSELRVAIQGFGNVGRWTAKFLNDWGAKVVAISDVNKAVYIEDGLPIAEMMAMKTLAEVSLPEISHDELLLLPVDILIPAAVENVITECVASNTGAKLIVEAANDPTTREGDCILQARGIPAIPDILANAGGVIASYIEWRQAKSGSLTERSETYAAIEKQLTRAFEEMVETVRCENVSHRLAAHIIAVNEVVESMRDRSWV